MMMRLLDYFEDDLTKKVNTTSSWHQPRCDGGRLSSLNHFMSVVFLLHRIVWQLSPKRQSARMSEITNDGLTQSGTGCFIVVPIRQQWASKG